MNYDKSTVFRKIGDVTLNEDHIGFCLRAEDVKEATDELLKEETFYPYIRRNNLQSVQIIKLVIQDTVLRRAPVLKKIEVWGFPSYKNSKAESQYILKLWRGIKENEDHPESEEEDSLQATEQTFNIPEEFLDSITNDLLVMPYILPSGNVIDETTMSKHNRHEEIYGRLPSDPFTGVIYTSDHQPKFHDVLKSRLDEFKLRNSDEIEVKQSGRTLGRKVPLPVACTSSFYSSKDHISKKIKLNSTASTDLDSLISSMYENKQVSVFTKPAQIIKERLTCCKCKTDITANLYRISKCSHLICKTCLLQQDLICGICRLPFQSKDVIKENL